MKPMKYDLEILANEAMEARGLLPYFSNEAIQQLKTIVKPAICFPYCEDMRSLLWCSIDNDESRDLDQLTYGKKESNGQYTIWVAVADVDALVVKDSAIDLHAQINTTSVYTPAKIYPMLPEELSTNLTSLNEDQDRVAIVVKIILNQEGEIEDHSISQAMVRNHAKLAYHSLGDWLEGKGPIPNKVTEVNGLEKAIKEQSEAAQAFKRRRHELGSLTFDPIKVEAKADGRKIILGVSGHNLAHQLIENFMIAANNAMANNLLKKNIPSLRRVVRIPKDWDSIVAVAAENGTKLPPQPNSEALEKFLEKMKKEYPERFHDLSLAIIKLLGRGEYVVETPNKPAQGHFGLALSEYMHSTAPNRRYPDLITQRQFKANLRGESSPYSLQDLHALAAHCTQQEDAATKVERQLNKSAAAIFLSDKIGKTFHGIVTGASTKGTWVRIFEPPIEGKLEKAPSKLRVGDLITVKLQSVDIPRGFINFVPLNS